MTKITGITLSILTSGLLLFSGCGSSGTSSATSASVSGTATDARVAGATVYVYSDKDLSSQIGQGTTSSDGNFSITLTQANVPSPIYFKTVGGLNVDDNMSAPSMIFVGDADANGKYNISPLTDMLYKEVLKGQSVTDATTKLVNQFSSSVTGFDQTDLFADPLTNADSNATLNKLLASGTATVSLTDGNYSVAGLAFDNTDEGFALSDINNSLDNYIDMNISINNGYITGTAAGGAQVIGVVSGTNILLDIIDGTNSVSKVAGTVGLFGSTQGTYVDMNSTGGIAKGVFVAQIRPATGVNNAAVVAKAASMLGGLNTFVARDYIGTDGGYVVSGDINVSDMNATDVTAQNFTVQFENNSTADGNISLAFDFNATSSKLLLDKQGNPTTIAIMDFNSSVAQHLYVVKPIGVRSGVYIRTKATDSNISAIGDLMLARTDAIMPAFDDGNNTMKIHVVTPALLGANRSNLMSAGYVMTDDIDLNTSLQTAVQAGARIRVNDMNETTVFAKGMLAMYKNDNGAFNETSSYIRVVKLLPTGAFQGEHINGGIVTLPSGSINLKNYPMPFVGNIHGATNGSAPAAISGTVNFAVRTLYVAAPDVNDYLDFSAGSLTINGTTATLTISIDQNGTVASPTDVSLTADFDSTYGIYHIYGPTGDGIIDIIWPVGATKAIYTSTNSDSNSSIAEIGEAFLSF